MSTWRPRLVSSMVIPRTSRLDRFSIINETRTPAWTEVFEVVVFRENKLLQVALNLKPNECAYNAKIIVIDKQFPTCRVFLES